MKIRDDVLLSGAVPADEVDAAVADVGELAAETAVGIAVEHVVPGATFEVIVPGGAQ